MERDRVAGVGDRPGAEDIDGVLDRRVEPCPHRRRRVRQHEASAPPTVGSGEAITDSEHHRITRFLYFYSHGIHHAYPDDFYRLVMVPSVSVPLAVIFYSLFYAVLPAGLAAGAFSGMVFGYLIYDYVHFATHHVNPPRAAWLRPIAEIMKGQRRRHMRHHFADHVRGYGVSTSLWDHVFRTHDPDSDR